MENISISELLELTKDMNDHKILKNKLVEYANGNADKLKDIRFRCDYFITVEKGHGYLIIKDMIEEVLSEIC